MSNSARSTFRTIIGINEVTAMTGVSKATIYRLIRRAEFPAPGGIGYRRKWYLDEVETWRDEQMARGHRPRLVSPSIGEAPAQVEAEAGS